MCNVNVVFLRHNVVNVKKIGQTDRQTDEVRQTPDQCITLIIHGPFNVKFETGAFIDSSNFYVS